MYIVFRLIFSLHICTLSAPVVLYGVGVFCVFYVILVVYTFISDINQQFPTSDQLLLALGTSSSASDGAVAPGSSQRDERRGGDAAVWAVFCAPQPP